jgi:hypothetical protein
MKEPKTAHRTHLYKPSLAFILAFPPSVAPAHRPQSGSIQFSKPCSFCYELRKSPQKTQENNNFDIFYDPWMTAVLFPNLDGHG